jgi:hypothetical protein
LNNVTIWTQCNYNKYLFTKLGIKLKYVKG